MSDQELRSLHETVMQRIASRFPELQSDEGFWDIFYSLGFGIAGIPIRFAEVAPDMSYALALMRRIQNMGSERRS
jgi:hypothetical protein